MMINFLKNRRRVLIFALTVMILSLLPYCLAYASQGEDWRFTGFLLAVEDGNSYLAKMMSGAWGEWLFKGPYTTEPQNGVIAFVPYIMLGKLTAPPGQHEQLVALYHGYRVLAGVLSILAVDDFLSLFMESKKYRWSALILSVLGGGLGWIPVLLGRKGILGSLPLDFISPESFGFLSLFTIPHLSLARALFLWGMVFFLTDRSGWRTGLCWLIMGLLQPMFVVLGWAVLAAYLAVKIFFAGIHFHGGGSIPAVFQTVMPELKAGAIAWVISAPIAAYTAYVFTMDPYLSAWGGQKIVNSPHPGHYLLAYGLMLPLMLVNFFRGKIIERKMDLFLLAWTVAFPVLVYAPVTSQRRLAEGFWVLLAAGVFRAVESISIPWVRKMRWAYLLLFPSSLLIFSGSIQVACQPAHPAFRPRDEIKAYQYFQQEDLINKNIISSFKTGNSLPAWAPVHVAVGHGPETPNRDTAEEEISELFSKQAADERRKEILNSYRADYLFWGPWEKNLGQWQPDSAVYLDEVYSTGRYKIFRIDKDD